MTGRKGKDPIVKRLLLACAPALMLCVIRAAADPPTEIDYQGQISVSQRPFAGTGYFKYAITDAAGSSNRWANDGSPSGEPATGCSQAVNDGHFSTLLGAPPMQPIDPAALAADGECFFRVWFSQDGSAFRELKPRQKVVSSPFAINALRLGGRSREFFEDAARLSAGTVADERLSATVTKLGATIGAGEIEAAAVGTREIADGSVRLEDLNLSDTDARYVPRIAGMVPGPLCVDGAVGIGTNQPMAALHVAGTARFEDGIHFLACLGDLSMGIYTNTP